MKGSVKADNGAEDCHRDPGDDNGVDAGAQPDDEQGSQGRFR